MKKNIALPVMIVAISAASVFGVTHVSAHSPEGSSSTIAKKIAERFGLSESEVEAVFEEEHAERQTQMQAYVEERLSEEVSAGRLTELQKEAIIVKLTELHSAKSHSNKENFKNMTPEQRREAGQSARAELESWADENGVDLKYLRMKGFGHKRL